MQDPAHSSAHLELALQEANARLAEQAAALAAELEERQKVEAALRESEELYRTLVDNMADAISINVAGKRVFVNQAFLDLCGLQEASQVIGTSVEEFYVPEDAHIVVDRTLARQRGEAVPGTYEARMRRVSGEVRTVETSAVAALYRGQAATLAVLRDVTERHRMEEELQRSQRLETLGLVAGQVAHDLNNLLGPLVALPEVIKASLAEGDEAAGMCDTMLLASLRIKDVIEDLRALGRRGVLNPKLLDVNQVVDQALEQMGTTPESLTIELRLRADLPVTGSETSLIRVLVNLVDNARKAMNDAGCLTIMTDSVYLDRPLGLDYGIEPGEYVRVDVSDTGSGIPEEIRDRIFEPFITTDRQRGSGLGLSVVQAKVVDHKGYVTFQTELGRGTTFSIYLPATQAGLPERPSIEVPQGTERILVVDDDPLQRETITQVLRRLGYRVHSVEGGDQAITYLAQSPVHLLILDMVMPPGIDGCETYRRIAEYWPGQRAIIVSGSAASERVKEAQALGAGTFVRKPLTVAKLAQTVREELDRRR
jgi:two-component system, cell cycle sensor histidine kinase and response regulator CckA